MARATVRRGGDARKPCSDENKVPCQKKTKRTAPFSWRDASTRRLDDRAYPVVFIGARQVRGAWCSLALGVDLQGNKHALGGRDDAQSASLLDELATRGLGAKEGLLVVTDGGRRVDDAVNRGWRGQALTQHCLYRLRQDLLAHVSEQEHPFVEQSLDTVRLQTVDEGRAALQSLHRRLETDFPGAAARLGRSVNAALTVARLGVSPLLRKYLQIQGMIRFAFERSVNGGTTPAAVLPP